MGIFERNNRLWARDSHSVASVQRRAACWCVLYNRCVSVSLSPSERKQRRESKTPVVQKTPFFPPLARRLPGNENGSANCRTFLVSRASYPHWLARTYCRAATSLSPLWYIIQKEMWWWHDYSLISPRRKHLFIFFIKTIFDSFILTAGWTNVMCFPTAMLCNDGGLICTFTRASALERIGCAK